MSIDENKALVRRYYEDARYHPDVCDDIFAPVVHWHAVQRVDTPDFDTSPQNEKSVYAWLDAVWGSWRMDIEEMIAEGDRVVVRWTFKGTHQGEFSGVPATYRPVAYPGINIFRVEGGKIAEVWDIIDRLGLWQQLGVLPETKEFTAKKADG